MQLFRLALLCIVLLGFSLRWLDYSVCPPYEETKDELAYPWAGLSMIQTRTIISWSPFKAYPVKYEKKFWGETFTLVEPYLEKPMLYPMLVAATCLAHGERTFPQVRLSTVRLVPLFLSLPAIWFLGLAAAQLGGPRLGLLTAGVYATLPTIVLGNRLSLTENLLIPLTCFSWWLLGRNSRLALAAQALTCALAVLTKQPGVYVAGAVLIALYAEKRRSATLMLALVTFLALLLHPLMAWHYDWPAYVGATEELRAAHAKGLPELVQTVVRYPVIGHKEGIFIDGSMAAGWLLLLTAPYWWSGRRTVLLYPLLYLALVSLGEAGTTFYGWHVYPLYPFVALALAAGIERAVTSGQSGQLAFLGLTLGPSALRFWLTLRSGPPWQPYLAIVLLLVFLVASLAHHGRGDWSRRLGWGLVLLWLVLNVDVVAHLPQLYKVREQPF